MSKVIILFLCLILSGCDFNYSLESQDENVENSQEVKQDLLLLDNLVEEMYFILGDRGFKLEKYNAKDRLMITTNVYSNFSSDEKIKKHSEIILKKIKGKILDSNGIGAEIYCLNENTTFEIHEPLIKSKKKYDMNKENKGIYTLMQLRNEWNIRIFQYKYGNENCRGILQKE